MALDGRIIGRPDTQDVPLRPAPTDLRANPRFDPASGGRVDIPRGNRFRKAKAGGHDRAGDLAEQGVTAVVVVVPKVAAGWIGISYGLGAGQIDLRRSINQLHAGARPAAEGAV